MKTKIKVILPMDKYNEIMNIIETEMKARIKLISSSAEIMSGITEKKILKNFVYSSLKSELTKIFEMVIDDLSDDFAKEIINEAYEMPKAPSWLDGYSKKRGKKK